MSSGKALKKNIVRLLRPEDAAKRNGALLKSIVFGVILIISDIIMGMVLGWETVPRTGAKAAEVFVLSFSAAAVTESLRSCILQGFSRFGAWKVGIAAALIFAAAEILTSASALDFGTPLEGVNTVIGIKLPAVCTSSLLTVLSTSGGVLPALVYRVCVIIVSVFPMQPAKSKFFTLFSGVILPLFFIIALDLDRENEEEQPPEAAKAGAAGAVTESADVDGAGGELHGGKAAGTAVTVIIAVFMIMFFWGLLPVFPTAVASGSMEPVLNVGDMAVISEFGLNDLEEGDIIAFTRDGAIVVHRITGMGEADGVTVYYTGGDANNADDAGYVTIDDIQGKMIFKIPYVGWVSLWFHG